MKTIIWIAGIFITIASIVVCNEVYERRKRRRSLDEAFGKREPLNDQTFHERYFAALGVLPEVSIGVRQVLTEIIGADLSRLSADDSLHLLLAYDDFDIVELHAALEERFGQKLADDAHLSLTTVGDFTLSVDQYLKKKKGDSE